MLNAVNKCIFLLKVKKFCTRYNVQSDCNSERKSKENLRCKFEKLSDFMKKLKENRKIKTLCEWKTDVKKIYVKKKERKRKLTCKLAIKDALKIKIK